MTADAEQAGVYRLAGVARVAGAVREHRKLAADEEGGEEAQAQQAAGVSPKAHAAHWTTLPSLRYILPGGG